MLADEYKQLGKHIAGGAAFVSNFVLWNESGYFDNSASTKPLIHLWSLAVEEQFYITWPLLLWLAYRKRINLLKLSIFVAFISFCLNIYLVRTNISADFYFPQTRFWELMIGSLLAWMTLHMPIFSSANNLNSSYWNTKSAFRLEPDSFSNMLPNALSLVAVALLTYGFLRIDKNIGFPGEWALVPVLGSALIIFVGPKAWINRALLSNKVLVWFGLISYPLYLWHWPLLSFARIIEGVSPSQNLRIAAVIISIALAWLTFILIERQVRFSNQRLIPAALCMLMAFIGSLGYYTYKENGFNFRVSEFAKLSDLNGEWEFPGKLTAFSYDGRTFYRQNSNKKDVTMFVGDSNMEQYYARADELITSMPNKVNSIIFLTDYGCLPIPSSPYDDKHKHCITLMESALEYAKKDANVKNIAISALWNAYLSEGAALNGNFQIGSKDYEESLNRLADYIQQLKKANKNVFLILGIPMAYELDPKYMASRSFKNFPHILNVRNGGVKREYIDNKYGKIQEDLSRIANTNGAIIISPLNYLCNSVECPSIDNKGDLMYRDSTHLRASYVRKNAFFIDKALFESAP